MGGINWQLRWKSKTFWLSLIPAVLLLVQVVAAPFGYKWDFVVLNEQLAAIVNALFAVLAILGVVTDPTTEGFADSLAALAYIVPKPRDDTDDTDDTEDNDNTHTKTTKTTLTLGIILALVLAGGAMTTPREALAKTSDGYYEGVDLSHWDSGLDLGALTDDCDLDFAIVKVGGDEDAVGGRYRDSQFTNFYKQARNAGLHVGAYYYTDVRDVAQARQDADHCADLLDGYDLDMPVYMDVEDGRQASWLTRRELTDVIISFCERLEERGYRAGIYTSGSWWNGEVYAAELDAYSDWVAWWGRSTWPQIDGIYSGLWQVGGISWGHNTHWDPDSGNFYDYDLCRIEYWDDAPQPTPTPTPDPDPDPEPGKLEVDGVGGYYTTTALQEALGTPADGEISGQWIENYDYHWAMSDSVDYSGDDGSLLVSAIQEMTGAYVDGQWGPETSRRLQQYLEDKGYSVGMAGVDSLFGSDSVKALQRALNDGVIDGTPAPKPEPEPDPDPRPERQGSAKAVVEAALGEVGYYAPDDPEPGSKYGRWYAKVSGEDWCAGPSWEIWWCEMFVSWSLDAGGVYMEGSPTQNTNLAYNNGGWKYEVGRYDIHYGDVVQFDWNWDGLTDHVGIATGAYDGYGFPTVEGNVGNAVVETYRNMGNVAHVLRPDYV